ncbi:MAG: hypothetical protein LBB23_02475 [Rickettsiales bacterium]|nr:hypothetical protein [Rickettsiales bacterium]
MFIADYNINGANLIDDKMFGVGPKIPHPAWLPSPETFGGELSTTPSAYASLRRDTPSPAKGTFVRLTSTNHPVRLRFATARHPST